MLSAHLKKTAYRAWHRALFRLQTTCGLADTSQYPAQTIFVHVPKTAGSSINEYFSSFVGGRHGNRYVPVDMFKGDAYNAEVGADGLEKARQAQFVTGHIDWDTVAAIRQPRAFVFTILRDPAERLLSNYHYIHRIDEDKQPSPLERDRLRKMKSLSFAEYCTNNDPEHLFFTNNFMVRQLAGRLDGTAAADAPFEEILAGAVKNLQTMAYVGFQQTLGADFELIVRKIGFPPLKLPNENITKKLAAHPGPSYEASANKQDILTLAADRLRWDMAFYQKALELAPEINKRPFLRE